VSVIHSRPSVICPPRTEALGHVYQHLLPGPESLERRVAGYEGYPHQYREHYPPPYYQHSTSSSCSDTSTNSFTDWPSVSSPQTFDQELMMKLPPGVSLFPVLSESPSPPVIPTSRKFPPTQPVPFSAPRARHPSKQSRARKLTGPKSDPFTFPPDENSFPESDIPKKKIKLEGAAELKEKVGNKPISNCRVCGDLAVAHMHYGGVCCYSCKAFFRRATQTGKDKKYKCKSDRQCSITYTNRRSCQYCRFNKCLEIGMKPNWVLSDEQCNIRFRNVRKEAAKDKSNPASDMAKAVIKEEVVEVSKGLLMPFTGEESKSLEFLVDCYNLSKETFTFSEENDQLWTKLFKQDSSQRSSPGRKYDYSTFDLGSLIMTVIKKNIFFVKMNDKFVELNNNDQKLILQKNMSEMCHIRGAIRFDTKSKNFVWYFSKKDQMQMAYTKKSSSHSSSSQGSSKDSRLKNALIGQQDMSKFYKGTTSQNIFGLVGKLCEIGLPMEVFLLMINIVLFSSDGLSLEQPEVTGAAQTYFMFFLHRYLNELFGRDDARMKLSRIMGILVDLRELCERSKEEELARIKMSLRDKSP